MYAEAPSLTSYKDKSDEFSLSVPASESSTTLTRSAWTTQTAKILRMTFILHMTPVQACDTRVLEGETFGCSLVAMATYPITI